MSTEAAAPTGRQVPEGQAAPVLCVLGASAVRSWGLTPAERARRLFAQNRVSEVIGEEDLAGAEGPVILMRGDAVIDPPLAGALLARPDMVLMSNFESEVEPVAAHATPARIEAARRVLTGELDADRTTGLTPLTPDQLGAGFWQHLRKRETPYALRITPANRSRAEWRMFMGTYKGATDFVTKHLWPRPAFLVTRVIAPVGITPNMVTAASAALVVAAIVLFAGGAWAAGLAAAWLMTFLDTVDGKLARTTLTTSRWGDIFDHGIDLVHPPFWYWAWSQGVLAAPYGLGAAVVLWSLGIILAGYLLQRLMEGIAIKRFGFEIHIWRPVDTWFRQITARRNPNLVILTLSAPFGRPDLGLAAVAVWTALCLALHAAQLAQAAAAQRRQGALASWMSRPA